MYWKLEEAIKELKIRKKDKRLGKKVKEFLNQTPIVMREDEVIGFLARHIASGRLEDIQFEERCKKHGIIPVNLEYLQDLFIPENPSKRRLVELYIFKGYGKKGGRKVEKISLVNNIESIKKKKLIEITIKTQNGEIFLYEFHHHLRKYLGLKGEIVDISHWLKEKGGKAEKYYPFLMAFGLKDAIIFESFDTPCFPDLDLFKKNVVLPAIEFIVKEFGEMPLIVYHPEVAPDEEEFVTNYYSAKVVDFCRGVII
jgi:hypothetical protein